jgi:hypothetical protein
MDNVIFLCSRTVMGKVVVACALGGCAAGGAAGAEAAGNRFQHGGCL